MQSLIQQPEMHVAEDRPQRREDPTGTWSPWHKETAQQPPLFYYHQVMAGRNKEHPLAAAEPPQHLLEIEGVDFMLHENGLSHHTDRYELQQQKNKSGCVVRRGMNCRMVIVCAKRQFDCNRDRIKIVLEFGSKPSFANGTKAVASLLATAAADSGNKDHWSAIYERRSGQRLELILRIPFDAPVGMWRMSIDTSYGDDDALATRRFRVKEPLYVLFNPYQEGGMERSAPLFEEYLLGEVGKVYVGSRHGIRGRPWVFGQMRDTVLPIVCHLLDSAMEDSERGDPVAVARAIANMVCGDGKGVLNCCWSGNYMNDHTRPSEWTGSVAILEEYMEKGKPVKYAHCWVVAGVVTTIFRSLGIRCRTVTNFVSAENCGSHCLAEKHFDEEGEPVGGGHNNNSIWTFKVWNEVWLERADLPEGFGGWQVIDAAPQYKGKGHGPTSVEAVRRGETALAANDIYSKVNSALLVFATDKRSIDGCKLIGTNSDRAGQLIVTKVLGFASDDAEEDFQIITQDYKNEGAPLPATVERAIFRTGGGSKETLQGDVMLQMIDLDKGKYGEPYKASLFLQNQSNEPRTVKIVMSTSSAFYTGQVAHLVKKGSGEFLLQPNEKETLRMEVSPEDYLAKSTEYRHFTNRFLVSVAETGQMWHGIDTFSLKSPARVEAIVAADAPVRVGKPCKIVVRLTNPLKEELSNCVMALEAPGVVTAVKRRVKRMRPGEAVEVTLDALPWRAGPTTIVAVFNSRELGDVTGTRKLTVLD